MQTLQQRKWNTLTDDKEPEGEDSWTMKRQQQGDLHLRSFNKVKRKRGGSCEKEQSRRVQKRSYA